MLRHRFFDRLFLLGAFFSITLLSLPGAEPASAPSTKVDTTADYRTRLEKETFALINQYRLDNKLPALQWNDDIAQVAREHSKDMATGEVDFGHEGFGKRASTLKGKLAGLKGAGENVFKTDDPNQVSQVAVKVWLNSPHHLANIRGDFNYSGMGVWKDGQGVIYFTQFFVKVAPKAQTQPPTQTTQTASPPTSAVNPYTQYMASPVKTR